MSIASGVQQVVLLVDDEPLLRRATGRLLESLGYQVVTAEDGAAAEDALRASNADVVLLDLMLPGQLAHQTFVGLRRIKTGIPIVLCSGHRVEEVATALLTEPDVFQLPKPFSRANLIELFAQVFPKTREPSASG